MDTKKLTELHQKLNSYRPLDPEEVRLLEKNIKIDHVYSSNAIEGSTLSRGETEKTMQPFEDLVGQYAEKTLTERIKILQLNEQNKRDAAKETNLPPNYWQK